MKNLQNSLYFKLGAITLITLLLLIPAAMVRDLVRERQNTESEAVREVSSNWGEEQTLSGPFISIPYNKLVKRNNENNSGFSWVKIKDYIHILPETINVTGNVEPEIRSRGIHEVAVYTSDFSITGSFQAFNFNELDIPRADIHFDKAKLVMGISDLRGIDNSIELLWNKKTLEFKPGPESQNVVSNGINASIPMEPDSMVAHEFNIKLSLKGSQGVHFSPLGKTTVVDLTSPWKDPSFSGSFLPDSREVSNSGFESHWSVLHLNRNFPQFWLGSKYSIKGSTFGVKLLKPVDNYRKVMRCMKYAILFIVFTFITFFFIEILRKKAIHPLQYILVGIALIIFFSLLLAITEHLSFNAGYLISSVATIFLIGGYIKAIIKSGVLVGLITGILSLLYGFIFVVMQIQDYALLIGSIGIFVVLAVLMYCSRKVNWYQLNNKD